MKLWILVGAPGSGKTWFARHVLTEWETVRYISRDEIRYSMVHSNEPYFSKEKLVFKEFVSQIKEALEDEDSYITDIIADATHLNWSSRSKLLSALGILTGDYKELIIIPVVIRTSLEKTIAQNNSRNGRARVPEADVKRMYHSITDPARDPYKYAGIMYVDN